MIFRRLQSLLLSAPPLLALAILPAHAQTKAVAASTKPAQPIKVAEKPIPQFTVWQLRPGDSTESQVTPYQLNPSGYWLMLYVDSSSKASLDLLTQVQTLAQTQSVDRSGALVQPLPAAAAARTPSQSQFKLDPSKLVVVVAHASGAELSQFELNYPGLSSAAWTHDSAGAAAKLLGIHGTPHLFGMREGLQRWQLADTLRAQDLEPVMTTWSAFNRLPKNTLTRNKIAHPAPTSVANTAATSPPPTPAGPASGGPPK
jgi:hypothetical protein